MLVLGCGSLAGADVYWDAVGGNTWSTAASWSGTPDNTEPTITDDVILPTPVAGSGTITLSAGETANSLTFNQTYTLTAGNLSLGNWGQSGAGTITVANGQTGTIGSNLAGSSGLSKSDTGILTFTGVNLVTGGITLGAGKFYATVGLKLGNNAVIFNGGTLSLGWNNGASYLREFSGAGNGFGDTSGSGTDLTELRISALNDVTYSGGGIGSSGWGVGLNKTGPGTLTITGGVVYEMNTHLTAAWRGGLTFGGASGALLRGVGGEGLQIWGGTFTLDNSTANLADRYGDAMGVNVQRGGGTFRYIGQAATTSTETLGGFSLGAYQRAGATLNLDVRPGAGGSSVVTFGSYDNPLDHDWNSGAAMLNVTTTGTLGADAKVLFTTPPTLLNNVMPGTFANGTDIATYESATPNGVVPFNPVGGGGVAYVAAASAVATDTAYANANYTLTADKQWNALKIDGAQTIDLNGNNLSLGKSGSVGTGMGAMVVKSGAGEAEIRGLIAAKYFDSANASQSDNYTFMVNDSVLKVTAPLRGGSLTMRINKMGSGVLWLDPAQAWAATNPNSSYSSGIYFSEGVIRLDPRDTDFGNQTMVMYGGVMELTGGGTYSPTIGTGNANLSWQGTGGFAAKGTDAIFSPVITWNAANHLPDGAALLLNSATADKKITLSGTLNLGTDATKMYLREINVVAGAHADAVAEISGQIISDNAGTPTYTYHLVKTGAGTLILSHADNTYSGATYVKVGTLLVNGQLDAPASTTVALNPDATAITVMNAATLGGTGTITRNVILESGTTLTSTSTLTVGGTLCLANPNTASIAAGSVSLTGSSRIDGTLNGPGTLSVASTGTLAGTGTINASVSVTGGTLSPGNGGPGSLTIASLTFDSAAASFAVQLNGNNAGSGYDQLVVPAAGTLTLANVTLSASLGYAPASRKVFTIIDNQSAGAVTGTFNGLAEGATTTITGAFTKDFTISYIGGDGNDVTLTEATGNTAPSQVILSTPVNSDANLALTGRTINPRPRLIWTAPTDTEGDSLHFQIYLDTGTGTTSVGRSSVLAERTAFKYWTAGAWTAIPAGGVASGSLIAYTPQGDLAANTYCWKVRAFDGVAYGADSSAWQFIVAARTWTDDPMVANVTRMKKAHMDELYQETNYARAFRNLAPIAVPAITAGVTHVQAVHFTDLRTGIRDIDTNVTHANITTWAEVIASGTIIKASHINEMRTALGGL